ncbi:MAG: hypothetical protein P8X42_15450 [Calditrichaceae bacterium]|jgi:hypothetical protein
MKESDWKIFKQIKEKALEEYCQQSLDKFDEIIHDKKETVHKRYLSLYKSVRDRDKLLERMFDPHSRSKAQLQLRAMRQEGLADESLLAELSEEFLAATDPKRLFM